MVGWERVQENNNDQERTTESVGGREQRRMRIGGDDVVAYGTVREES